MSINRQRLKQLAFVQRARKSRRINPPKLRKNRDQAPSKKRRKSRRIKLRRGIQRENKKKIFQAMNQKIQPSLLRPRLRSASSSTPRLWKPTSKSTKRSTTRWSRRCASQTRQKNRNTTRTLISSSREPASESWLSSTRTSSIASIRTAWHNSR